MRTKEPVSDSVGRILERMPDMAITEQSPRKTRRRAAPSPNAFAFTVADAQAMGAPSRTTIYELIKAGILKTVDAPGCQQLITGDSLRALLSGKLPGQRAGGNRSNLKDAQK
jgi:hypothetical protein